ncbi:MAG: VRR-NUC domain-containing protein [Gammaproteobacteria bacterium]|nr:VRR-NUC domain-containing protein [Gammaproteobacteria bacterium]NVK87973.1 VRR-NUC domain-containing protein [Gammaproteobacteria bacterium]
MNTSVNTPPQALEADYYRVNFITLLTFVFERYAALLTEQERSFYHQFSALSVNAQCLFTRCLMRKGNFFRVAKFSYQEISEPLTALSELTATTLVKSATVDDFNNIITLFTKPELVKAFPEHSLKTLKRAELDAELIRVANDTPDLMFARLQNLANHSLIFVCTQAFDTFRLLFFGNLRQDLTEFVLQDMGIVKYPKFTLSRDKLPFQNRETIVALKKINELSDYLHDHKQLDIDELEYLCSQLPPCTQQSSIVQRRLGRLLNRLGQRYEQQKDYQAAIALYQQSNELPAAERIIRCLAYLHQWEEAWERLQQLETSSSISSEQHFVRVFKPKLAKKLAIPFERQSLQIKPEQVILITPHTQSVERNVQQHLSALGKVSFWSENGVFNSLFGLTFWSLLYADCEGAFYNPFQTAPDDIYHGSFIAKRESLWQELFQFIACEKRYEKLLRENYRTYFGLANRFIHWSLLQQTVADIPIFDGVRLSQAEQQRSLFEWTLQRVPIEHIRKIVLHILADRKDHRSGMPDLIVFTDQDYCLMEVKGPGDRLQNNQKVWLDFFERNEIPYRTLRVVYDENN